MQRDAERLFFAVAHRLNVTLAGQLPGEGTEAALSALTRQSTFDSPASSGGVRLAAITEPSVPTYSVASNEPFVPCLQADNFLDSLAIPSDTRSPSHAVGARTSFGGSKSKDFRARPCWPPTGLGQRLPRSDSSMHFSVSRSPIVDFSRCAPSTLPCVSICTKKLTEPPRNSTRLAPSSMQRWKSVSAL